MSGWGWAPPRGCLLSPRDNGAWEQYRECSQQYCHTEGNRKLPTPYPNLSKLPPPKTFYGLEIRSTITVQARLHLGPSRGWGSLRGQTPKYQLPPLFKFTTDSSVIATVKNLDPRKFIPKLTLYPESRLTLGTVCSTSHRDYAKLKN